MLKQLMTTTLLLLAMTWVPLAAAPVTDEELSCHGEECCGEEGCYELSIGHCTILAPHILDKIHEYGLANDIPELVELAEKTSRIADHHIHSHRSRHMSKLKEHHQQQGETDAVASGSRTPEPTISIYDAHGKQTFGLPWQYNTYTLENPTPPNSSSQWVHEALTGMFATLNFYWDEFKWNSIDGHGIKLKAIVNYANSFFNAYYDGKEEVFGNPGNNPKLSHWFGSFTSDIDVAAHELTHGVTAYKVNLTYQGQSGAINEHMSDVFGIQVKQYYYYKNNLSLPDTAKWKIGDQVLKDVDGQTYALRDMLYPGKGYLNHPILGSDPQPADFANYQPLPANQDNGGVHLYSGPLNRVFATVAEALGGNSWEHAGVIWYHAYDKLTANATFVDIAHATIATAQELFGSHVASVVKGAWDAIAVWDTQHTVAEAVAI